MTTCFSKFAGSKTVSVNVEKMSVGVSAGRGNLAVQEVVALLVFDLEARSR
jgi:hypothetical protein